MNEKFFHLPVEKQEKIINAGYQVFSLNSYKKSPMSEIAGAAGISKSLLFHYFRNKRELYLFLWNHCAEITIEYLTKYGCYEKQEFFEMMYREMYLASEGYLWEMFQRDELDIDRMERDFIQLIEFWKSVYLRKND